MRASQELPTRHFVTHRTTAEPFRRLTYFEYDPAPSCVPGLRWSAMRG